jgi:hypothetical protein
MSKSTHITPNLESVARKVGKRLKPGRLNAEKVAEALKAEGYEDPEINFIARVKAEVYRQQKADMENFVELLKIKLPLNPTASVIQQYALRYGREITYHRALKILESIQDFPGLKSDEKNRELRSKLSPVDFEIAREIQAATGFTSGEAVALALRVFVQTYAIHRVSIDTLVRTNQMTGDQEMLGYIKMLKQFDLRGIVG